MNTRMLLRTRFSVGKNRKEKEKQTCNGENEKKKKHKNETNKKLCGFVFELETLYKILQKM